VVGLGEPRRGLCRRRRARSVEAERVPRPGFRAGRHGGLRAARPRRPVLLQRLWRKPRPRRPVSRFQGRFLRRLQVPALQRPAAPQLRLGARSALALFGHRRRHPHGHAAQRERRHVEHLRPFLQAPRLGRHGGMAGDVALVLPRRRQRGQARRYQRLRRRERDQPGQRLHGPAGADRLQRAQSLRRSRLFHPARPSRGQPDAQQVRERQRGAALEQRVLRERP